MVAANKGRLAPRSSSSLHFSRAFRHPLLRIATGLDEAPQRYSAFQRLIRRALSWPPGSPERSSLAVEVLDELEGLELDEDSARAFRTEWLQEAARQTSSAYLIEALALEQLAKSGLELVHGAWRLEAERSASQGLPLLAVTESAPPDKPPPLRLPFDVVETLLKCVDLAMEAERDGGLSTWSPTDCQAAIRAIAMVAVNDNDYLPLREEAARELFFVSQGAGLWLALARRLSELPEAEDFELYWDGRMLQAVALHVCGRAHLAEKLPVADEALATSVPTPDVRPQTMTLRVLLEPPVPAFAREDKEAVKRYEPLLKPLPVARMPSIDQVERLLTELRAEFPWAEGVVDELGALLRAPCLFGVQELHLPPVLLVGFPGCGKTRLVRRVAEHLRLPFLPMPLGGVHDSKPFSGTPRGWSGGEPSPLLNVILRHKSASALVLLDELDKTSHRTGNSTPVTSALLGLLEPESARRWHDTFLQTTCDLSKLCFWGTANGLASIPKPLLSRFTVIYMPAPRKAHMQVLVHGIVDDIAKAWGLPSDVLPLPPREVYEGVPLNARELRRLVTQFLCDWGLEHRRPDQMH
jgi:hypothetical protein